MPWVVQDVLRPLDRPLQQLGADLNGWLPREPGIPLPVFPAETWLLNTYLDQVESCIPFQPQSSLEQALHGPLPKLQVHIKLVRKCCL